MDVLLATVVGGVLVAAIVGARRWFASRDNREAARQLARERFCRHQWEPVPDALVSPYREWCVKCDARR